MRAIRCILAAAVFLPAAAFGQTITSSFSSTSVTGTVSVNIGQSLCQGNRQIDFTVDWGTSVPATGTDTVSFFLTPDTTTCTDSTKDPAGTAFNPPLDQQTETKTYLVSELIAGLANGCSNTTATAATPFTVFFCVRRKTTNALTGVQLLPASLPVQVALVGPKAPTLNVPTAGDQHLKISWASNDAGDRTYDVFVVDHGTTPDTGSPAATGLQTTSVDISNTDSGAGLANGNPNDPTVGVYDVYVRSVDAYGNASALSAPVVGTPTAVEDFYNHYRNAGGTAGGGGGCSTGGTGFFAVLGALAALALRKRRAAAVLAVALCIAPAARADDWTGQRRPSRFLLVALKMDRYDPQIDSEADLLGSRPYHDIFHGRAPPRYQVEVDWQVAHPFGAILLGATGGFWQNYGHGIDNSGPTPKPSPDTTNIDIAPFGLVATYRFDVLADRYQWLPVVPYAQAGMMAALWSSFNGRGDVSTRAGGGHGSGWTYGYTTALGVALSLDSMDAELAREAYIELGLQRTALFAEYGWTHLNDFGKSGTLILTDHAWRFGVSLEF